MSDQRLFEKFRSTAFRTYHRSYLRELHFWGTNFDPKEIRYDTFAQQFSPSMSESILNAKLRASLASRESRSIRRRLPESATSSVPDLIDFNSNDYLSLSASSTLRKRFLNKLSVSPDILGSGGSRLLVNGSAHSAFEERLRTFFGAEAALLFNSGFDANVGFFSCIPQPGDALIFDEYIHASVHDGMRASRVADALYPFKHNDITSFKHVLARVKIEHPGASVFVAVESLYSMDGTFAPLKEISEALDGKDMYLVVDEAHATGIYGPQGRGRVAELGLEDKVLARLHTFGKALAATGGGHLTQHVLVAAEKSSSCYTYFDAHP